MGVMPPITMAGPVRIQETHKLLVIAFVLCSFCRRPWRAAQTTSLINAYSCLLRLLAEPCCGPGYFRVEATVTARLECRSPPARARSTTFSNTSACSTTRRRGRGPSPPESAGAGIPRPDLPARCLEAPGAAFNSLAMRRGHRHRHVADGGPHRARPSRGNAGTERAQHHAQRVT